MQPTSILTLAGKDYEIRFDIMALTAAQNLMKAMGYKRDTAWTLADLPYDLGEEILLVAHGINGAKRLNKDKNLVTIEDAQNLLEEHFAYVADKVSAANDDTEAMKLFNEEQTKLMETLSAAVRQAMGFRRAKGGAPGRV